MSVSFEAETAAEPLGGGRYRAHFSRNWWVHAGPNGGIVAATVLRACSAEVAAGAGPGEDRFPRTLTVHYLAPPREGPAEVAVTVERAGKGVTFLSARLTQDGRSLATALAAYAGPRQSLDFLGGKPMPEVPPPDHCPALDVEGPTEVTIRDRWETRWALGPIPGGDGPGTAVRDGALAGGWLRLAHPERLDHHVVAAMADAWLPPVFALPDPPPVLVPTVELTVHFRDSETLTGRPADTWFLCAFRSEVAQEGFLEEDGLIWAPEGRLVAVSRQLAALSPRPDELGPRPAWKVAP